MAVLEDRSLIDEFFAALLSNDVNRCENLSQELAELSNKHPAYYPWSQYVEAVLIKNRDNNWEAAEKIYIQLLSVSDLESFLRGQVLLSMGSIKFRQGLWIESIDVCKQALTVFAELEESTELIKTWLQMAQCYSDGFQQGALDKSALRMAVKYSTLAADMLEQMGSVNEPALLANHFMALLTLGGAEKGLNDWQSAIVSFQKCIEIARQLGNRYFELFPNFHLADTYIHLGHEHLDAAIAAGNRALSIAQESEDRYQEFWICGLLGFLHRTDNAYSKALACYDQAFALVDEVRASIPDAQPKTNFMATVTEEYANAVLTAIEAEKPEKAFEYVEQARGRVFLELLESGAGDIQKGKDGYRVMDGQVVQRALPPDYVILSYYTTGVIESTTERYAQESDIKRVRFPEAKTFVFVLTQDSIQVFDTALDPNQIIPGVLNEAIETYFLRDGMRKFLHSFLVRPIQHLLSDKKRVAICPHGPLHFVPFHALIDATGTGLLKHDGPEIIYASSATVLMRDAIQNAGTNQSEWVDKKPNLINGCLTIGFDGILNEETDEAVAGLAPLSHAETEATTIAHMTNGRALIGVEPKKAQLLKLAPDFLYLHFSCHGVFRPEAPMQSTLYIGPDETLTASEVVNMPHLNCRLVTLSACESGMNQVKRGDELYGFARAFFQAGAKAIIAAQWRVDERTTRIFAEKFVEQLRLNVDAATALKIAQLALQNITKSELTNYIERFDNETSHGKLISLIDQSQYEQTDDSQIRPSLEDLLDQAADEQPILIGYPFYWAPYILIGDPDL